MFIRLKLISNIIIKIIRVLLFKKMIKIKKVIVWFYKIVLFNNN